jgi:hypothetical protein
MKMKMAFAVAAALAGVNAHAATVELSGHAGQAFPFYEQSFEYDPGSALITLPGVGTLNLGQSGAFRLEGKGGSSLGGAVTLYLAPHVGIEARVDSAAVDIRTSGATYHLSIDLPAPLPDITQDLQFADGTVDVDRLQPLSLNLKLKTPGRVGLVASGGISYLPEVQIAARQRVGFGIPAIQQLSASFSVGSIVLRSSVKPGEADAGNRIGGNIGGGVRLQLAGPLAVSAEARYFHFSKHKIEWEPEIEGTLSVIEETLLAEMKRRLKPIEFYPAFFQATAGVSLAF